MKSNNNEELLSFLSNPENMYFIFGIVVIAFLIIIVSAFFNKPIQSNVSKVQEKLYDTLNENAVLNVKPDEIENELSKLRRYRKLFWFFFLMFLPIGGLSIVLSSFFTFFKLIPFVWMGFIGNIVYKWWFFKCPNCGYIFHSEATWGNPWASQCVHCKLALKQVTK